MSLHRSLKVKPTALQHHRNVLKRSERIAILTDKSAFDPEEDSPLALVKVANRLVVRKKPKKEEEAGEMGELAEGVEGIEGSEGTAPDDAGAE